VSLRSWNDLWDLIAWKAAFRLFAEVSVGNVSITLPGEVFWRLERTLVRFS
jgi:hypothetical protein